MEDLIRAGALLTSGDDEAEEDLMENDNEPEEDFKDGDDDGGEDMDMNNWEN